MKISEEDKVSIIDMLSDENMESAIEFVLNKYQCSRDEAVDVVGDIFDKLVKDGDLIV